MKALAIDSATTRISISAINATVKAAVMLQAEMKQSEKLVPAIDYVLGEVNLTPKDLDFTVTSSGPGSFTNLRLGMSALKAIQLATGCPLYTVPTLRAYAYPFTDFSGTVVPVIDAKKERFYVSIYRNGTQSLEDSDLSPLDALSYIDPEETILITGDDAPLFCEKILAERPTQRYRVFKGSLCVADSLLCIGEKLFLQKEPSAADYDGPVYIRKSEAEEKSGAR